MTNSLYTEAIADAKAIREAAEERAKQQLVETMSPKIKDLVEKAILGEDIGDLYPGEFAEEELDPEFSEEEINISDEDPSALVEPELQEPGEYDEFSDESLEDTDSDLAALNAGHKISGLNLESKRVIDKLISKDIRKKAIIEKLLNLKEATKKIKPALLLSENVGINDKSDQKINKILKIMLKEFKLLSGSKILKTDKQLFETYLELTQEFMSMYKRRRKNRLNESIEDLFENDFLFEEDEDEDEAGDAELDLEEPEGDEEEMDLDLEEPEGGVSADTTVGELAAMAGIGEEEDLEGEEEEFEFGEEEPEGGEEEDLETENYNFESDDVSEDDMEEGETFLEIDEKMLRDEIGKMKSMREGDAAAMASSFGGGKKEKEMFVDMKDKDLNKNDHVSKVNEAARKVVRQNRQLKGQLKEYKDALNGMKGQLQEMNLFNAKLLYANKLMQNKDLSLKQQKHIVESLDNAKTLREAKILFEGLTKSLNKNTGRPGNLTEGTSRRVLGTSSRSTRSAQPANNRVEVDRWALLAGIKG